MGGTVHGKIDCVSSAASGPGTANEMFKSCFDFMELMTGYMPSIVSRVSLQYGNSGTGTDFHDGAFPFQQNAFAVYKFAASLARSVEFYVLFQYTDGTSWGSGVGAPALASGSTSSSQGEFGMAFAAALASDNTTNVNPWKGGTAGNGSDTKGTPVWDDDGVGGSLCVFPISNADGNSHAASRQNLFQCYSDGNSSKVSRWGFLADEDNFVFYVDPGDALASDIMWFGLVEPRQGVSLRYPFGFLFEQASLSLNVAYGSTAGTSTTRDGGVWNESLGNVDIHTLISLAGSMSGSSQPSSLFAPAEYEEFPLVTILANNVVNRRGVVGELDPNFIQVVYGVPSHDTNAGLSRYVVGSNSSTTTNVTVPWGGAHTPRTSASRSGVDF